MAKTTVIDFVRSVAGNTSIKTMSNGELWVTLDPDSYYDLRVLLDDNGYGVVEEQVVIQRSGRKRYKLEVCDGRYDNGSGIKTFTKSTTKLGVSIPEGFADPTTVILSKPGVIGRPPEEDRSKLRHPRRAELRVKAKGKSEGKSTLQSNPRDRIKRGGYVYFLKELLNGWIKIGMSTDYKRRINHFELILPYTHFELVHVIEGDDIAVLERYFHIRYQTERVHTNQEWFALSEDEVVAIKKISNQKELTK
jgi:hypothetical protein